MASSVPPKKGAALTTSTSLVSASDGTLFQDDPTLAAGDVKVSKDGGAFANIETLPVAIATNKKDLTVVLSAAEMNADKIVVQFSDAAGAEWCDQKMTIHTSVDTFDTLYQGFFGNWVIVNNQLIMYDTDGTTALKTYNLFQDGTATEFNPDERTEV